jgi:thiopurine S-methyltransferase
MQPDFWLERWQRNEIGFHQPAPHRALARHWASLGLPRSSRVLVPLAGKSSDMLWLAAAGHHVVGIELAELAVRAFFDENALAPKITEHGALRCFSVEGLDLWCGDVFAIGTTEVGRVAAVFDRAALVALPPELRQRYVAHLDAITPPGTRTLLITMEYSQTEMPGPPHAVLEDEVRVLYRTHAIELLERDDAMADFPKFAQRGVTRLGEAIYRCIKS